MPVDRQMSQTARSPRPAVQIRGLMVAVLIVGLIAAVLPGCNRLRPGGQRRSVDQFVFESVTWMPQTITLIDLRDGAELFTFEVPIDQKLVVRFEQNKSLETLEQGDFPDLMLWEVYPLRQRFGPLRNSIAAPPAHARVLRTDIRGDIEAPEDFVPADELSTQAPKKDNEAGDEGSGPNSPATAPAGARRGAPVENPGNLGGFQGLGR